MWWGGREKERSREEERERESTSPTLLDFCTFFMIFKGRNLPLPVPTTAYEFGGCYHSHSTSVPKGTRKNQNTPAFSSSLPPCPPGPDRCVAVWLSCSLKAVRGWTSLSPAPITQGCTPLRASTQHLFDKYLLMPTVYARHVLGSEGTA